MRVENGKNAYDMRNNQLIEVAIGNRFVFVVVVVVVVDFIDLVRQLSNISSASVYNSLFAGYFTGAPVIQVSTLCMMISLSKSLLPFATL